MHKKTFNGIYILSKQQNSSHYAALINVPLYDAKHNTLKLQFIHVMFANAPCYV